VAVIAAAIEIGVGLVDIRKALEDFTGTAKRMEKMGDYRGVPIYTDYAHHPTEVRTTLEGFRQKFPSKKIITVFHPHTFTRTLALLDDFAKSFDATDELILLDIYGSAREQQGGVHVKDLMRKIVTHNSQLKTTYIPEVAGAEESLRENIGGGDVVMLMEAGDAFRIGEALIND
jgi:UDP-N-acetylmuramate--alanine ligase